MKSKGTVVHHMQVRNYPQITSICFFRKRKPRKNNGEAVSLTDFFPIHNPTLLSPVWM